jgi:hypothetical protein
MDLGDTQGPKTVQKGGVPRPQSDNKRDNLGLLALIKAYKLLITLCF